MQLTQLIYCSRANGQLTRDDITAIEIEARQRNGRRGITGLLLYSAGHFIQLLEGDRTILTGIYGEIARDPRHTLISLLYFGPARSRLFSAWRMGVLDMGTAGHLDSERLRAFVNPVNVLPSPAALLAMLRDFRCQLPAESSAAALETAAVA